MSIEGLDNAKEEGDKACNIEAKVDNSWMRRELAIEVVKANPGLHASAIVEIAATVEHYITNGIDEGVEKVGAVLNQQFWFEVFHTIGLSEQNVRDLVDVLELQGFRIEKP